MCNTCCLSLLSFFPKHGCGGSGYTLLLHNSSKLATLSAVELPFHHHLVSGEAQKQGQRFGIWKGEGRQGQLEGKGRGGIISACGEVVMGLKLEVQEPVRGT